MWHKDTSCNDDKLCFDESPFYQSIEDFILLVGTSVAFIAFILWCCFPIEPKDSLGGSEHLTTQVCILSICKCDKVTLGGI